MSRLRLASRSPLPDAEFRRRHRGLLWLLFAQVVALPLFGIARGWAPDGAVLVCLPAAAFGVLAAIPRFTRTWRASLCVMGLLSCSAALVWLWDGQTEAHFHYFVMVGAVALYEAALPYAIAFVFVIAQHGLMSAWMPGRVYGSMVAMHHPWVWAGVHGGFIAALGAANLLAMRTNENTRLRETAASQDALRSTRRFERAFAGAPNGAALVAADGTILDANAALARSLRTEPEKLVGTSWFQILDADERDAARAAWPPAEPSPDDELRVRRADGSEAWMLVTHSRLPGQVGDAQWITQTLDVTRRRSAEALLAHQADHDPLTSLLNRRAFCERAQAILDTPDHPPIALLFCDVDDFKLINDSLGHAAGDQLLMEVADRLGSTLREGDLLGRFGGDEFVVCLRDISENEAEIAAAQIARAIAAPFLLAGVERRVTVSTGVVAPGAEERSIDSLVRDSDLAMYEAKAAGKARHVWFGPEMRNRAIDRLELETDLREAVRFGALEAHFQPQVRISDQRVIGFEALARWHHPRRGNVPPGVFIPIAERSGLIGEISAHILRIACRQMRRWEAVEPALGELRISMNASPRCICDPELPAVVAEILQETGIAPDRVCIEITESAVIARGTSAQSVIDALKEIGVSLAIDDFGIGQSSLSQLARLGPIDELKIDKAFIDDITTNRTAQRLTGAIIDVATGDGLTVVAEGVEEHEQLEVLRELGCPTVQGYLYSRPLPPWEFIDFLRESGTTTAPASATVAWSTSAPDNAIRDTL